MSDDRFDKPDPYVIRPTNNSISMFDAALLRRVAAAPLGLRPARADCLETALFRLTGGGFLTVAQDGVIYCTEDGHRLLAEFRAQAPVDRQAFRAALRAAAGMPPEAAHRPDPFIKGLFS